MAEDGSAQATRTKSSDPRSVRSREALQQALLVLVERKPFERIAIKEITAQAGVSYPVFFRQYRSKEDLLGDIAAREVRNLVGFGLAVADPITGSGGGATLCAYVDGHRTLWTTLLTAGAASIMRGEFIRLSKEIAGTRSADDRGLPLDLAVSVSSSVIFETLAWWLRQPPDYPIDNVAALLETLAIHPVRQRIALQPY